MIAHHKQVFKPLLLVQEDWGQTPDVEKTEFIEGMNNLSDVLDEAVRYLAEGCQLKNPDAHVRDATYKIPI